MSGKSVYAGNLSWSVTDRDLLDLMEQAGDVLSAAVIRYPDGRSKGWGLVEFADPSSAQEAINTLNDRELLGRKIFIREDREPPGSTGGAGLGGTRTPRQPKPAGERPPRRLPAAKPRDDVSSGTALFVGNLPWSTTWQQLKDMFAEYNVKYADVKSGYDGRSRGYGIVRFDTEEDANAALALNSYEIEGREIIVRYDRQSDE
jgi:RNA recognition motif-containing protein